MVKCLTGDGEVPHGRAEVPPAATLSSDPLTAHLRLNIEQIQLSQRNPN